MRNLKKVIALVAVFAMLVSTVAFANAFSDVASTDNYAEAIEMLNALGIITGDDQDNDGVMDFRPADTITRAEVTAIVARIQGMNNAAQTATEFADVPSTHWASGYVAQAASQGIVNGYGDGTFGPEDNVTYEQMIKMLMETLGYRPFAADNGGYPTGYTTAASRFGVLDEVIGGGIGVEASRGMVAQMVYNAIDTPLMDSVTYGTEKEYSIYDGTTYKFMTLLTRDLKMVKVTGTVVGNSYSNGVDTSAAKEVVIRPNDTTANYNYLGTVADQTYYQGEVDADPYLGYAVEVYAKKLSSTNDKYTLVAMSVNGNKDEITFNVDQFESYASNVIQYAKDENSSTVMKKTIEDGATIIYNGYNATPAPTVSAGVITAYNTDTELAKYFGPAVGALITKNGGLSGQVTLLDTNDVAGYDVVKIEVGVSGIIKEVTNNGVVRFLNTVRDKRTSTAVKLVFDEEDTGTIINVTKDGEAFDYTDLKKWDVVTVIWAGNDYNALAGTGYESSVYDVRVLGADNYVDGSVSVKLSDNSVDLSDGKNYDISADAYGISAASAQPGDAGRFYIDAYGKIIALDDDVVIGDEVIADNYAYVLDATNDTDAWGNPSVSVKVLDKSGEILTANLATKVRLKNMNHASRLSALASDDETIDLTSLPAGVSIANIVAALENEVITYVGNSAGQIKTITMSVIGDAEEDMGEILNAAGTPVAYDKDTMSFGSVEIADDTVVFYIDAAAALTYGGSTIATENMCGVGVGADLVEGSYDVVAIAPDADGVAQVVVLMNESGKIAPSSNIAVINTVGTSIVNGTDTVYTVTFYMNGELKSATTKVDMDTAAETAISSAKQGDIVKVAMSGDVITFASKVMNFTNTLTGEAYAKDDDNAPVLAAAIAAGSNADETFFFGAATKVSEKGVVTVAKLDHTGAVVNDLSGNPVTKNIKEGEANVYVYDPSLKVAKRLSVASLGDANIDEELAQSGKNVYDLTGTLMTAAPAYGMMDYVFARYYENRPADIVIYRNYNFGAYDVR